MRFPSRDFKSLVSASSTTAANRKSQKQSAVNQTPLLQHFKRLQVSNLALYAVLGALTILGTECFIGRTTYKHVFNLYSQTTLNICIQYARSPVILPLSQINGLVLAVGLEPTRLPTGS